MDIEINFTYTPDSTQTEKKTYRDSDREVRGLISDTLAQLKKNVNLYRKVKSGKVLGRMTLIQRKSLAGKPEVRVIFPVTHFPSDEAKSELLWQAEIVIDDRDWLYQTGKPFIVSMKKRYPKISSSNDYLV